MDGIKEIRDKLDREEVSSRSLFDKSVALAKKYQDKYNSFVTIMDEFEEVKSDSLIRGIPYALKDNISTRGILTTASSNILSNYVPLYDATVYKKLKEAGAVLVGKTVMDELAMGGTGTTGHTGIVYNPWDSERIIGGSSSGSAASVALGIVPYAIGSDTGDSIRKPAAYGGVVGFKSSYGRVSRYGLFAYASSLDHLGVIARSVYDVTAVMDVIKGHDMHDMTSLPTEDIKYLDEISKSVKGRKLFYIKEALENKDNDLELQMIIDNFKMVIEKCASIGIEVCEESVDADLLRAIYPAYMSISCAEATSNDANLTGIHFGVRVDGDSPMEIIKNSRTKGFGELIKRRFILGSYVLLKENQEKLFVNACRVRRMVVNKMEELYKKYDGMIMPAASSIAPKVNEKTDKLSDKYLILDNYMIIGNFGGYPSITIPSGFVCNMPVGVNITGKKFSDCEVLNISNKLEETMEYKGQVARGME